MTKYVKQQRIQTNQDFKKLWNSCQWLQQLKWPVINEQKITIDPPKNMYGQEDILGQLYIAEKIQAYRKYPT